LVVLVLVVVAGVAEVGNWGLWCCGGVGVYVWRWRGYERARAKRRGCGDSELVSARSCAVLPTQFQVQAAHQRPACCSAGRLHFH